MNEIEKTKIRNHIESENAKTMDWVKEDPDNRYAFTLDAESMIHMLDKYTDVTTFEEYKQYIAWEDYSERYKEKNGFKPRWTNWSENSDEVWNTMAQNL